MVEQFDTNFNLVRAFTDPSVAAGYAPLWRSRGGRFRPLFWNEGQLPDKMLSAGGELMNR